MEQSITNKEMLDLANRFLLSIKKRDWELLRLIISEDCIWRWPEADSDSNTVVWCDSVIKNIADIADRVIDLNFNKISFGLNGVAISLQFHTKMAGKETDKNLITVCILRGYLISAINSYLSDVEVNNAL
jgi:uncharacterized protein